MRSVPSKPEMNNSKTPVIEYHCIDFHPSPLRSPLTVSFLAVSNTFIINVSSWRGGNIENTLPHSYMYVRGQMAVWVVKVIQKIDISALMQCPLLRMKIHSDTLVFCLTFFWAIVCPSSIYHSILSSTKKAFPSPSLISHSTDGYTLQTTHSFCAHS